MKKESVQEQHIEKLFTPLLAIEEAARCLLCYEAPCSKACPAETNPGKFIRSLRFRNLKGAAETIRENNPLGGICAKVCPTEKYCEGACSRCGIDRPIQIAKLQEYLTTYEKAVGMEGLQKVTQNQAKVAIIGSGPAGLVAAATLALKGYRPTIFEKREQVGGWLTYGIPEFRLPKALISSEIETIEKLGVQYVTQCTFGEDETFETLKEKGFEAILIATGYSEAKGLALFDGYASVHSAVEFLGKAKHSQEKISHEIGSVVIVGGGDVAMDTAMTAKALGIKSVKVIAVEDFAHFPASKKELEHVRNHHISIIDGFKPISYDGKTVIFESLVDEATMTVVPDLVILAIGQEDGCIKYLSELDKDAQGNLYVQQYQTNKSHVFAAGDLVEGDKTVVYAIKTGKEAAQAIDDYLGGRN